jgi:hypothetical protein
MPLLKFKERMNKLIENRPELAGNHSNVRAKVPQQAAERMLDGSIRLLISDNKIAVLPFLKNGDDTFEISQVFASPF